MKNDTRTGLGRVRQLGRVAAWSIAAVGCGALGIDGNTAVDVRIENVGAVPFDRVVLYPGGRDSLLATGLGAGQQTPYQRVERAYNSATVRVNVGNQAAALQVIDYVGEKPLGNGRYSYLVRFQTGGATPTLTVEIRRD